MTKLNVYRACVLLCLAAVAYNWPVAGMLILVWWAGALLGLWAKSSTPPEKQDSTFRISNTDVLGLLEMWLGVWNGFYVWKDLDHDYWKRDREE